MGVLADRDILEHICYDGHDDQMLEMLKPCIDEGFVVQHREVSREIMHIPFDTKVPSDCPGLYWSPRKHADYFS